MRRHAIAGLLLLVLAITAMAEEPVTQNGKLFAAVSWTTDYRSNGISSSDRRPAIQASLHWRRPDDYYAGIWVSQVDFNDDSTSFEFDTYAGRRFPVGKTEYRLELMYSAFDEDVPGPTYDFLQFKAAATHALDQSSVTTSLRWSPNGAYGAGSTTYADVSATLNLADWLSLSGVLGIGRIERRPNRRFWNLGATAHWGSFYIDIRHVDTNLDYRACGFVDWCKPTIVATVTLANF
ncbi:MAG: TorF family putative porin [Pseudomonadales bacterium]